MRAVVSVVVASMIATSAVALSSVTDVGAVTDPLGTVFISEIHYDNAGTDAGEAVEVFGPAGTDLSGWSIVLYNGANGQTYRHRSAARAHPGRGRVWLRHRRHRLSGATASRTDEPDGIALRERYDRSCSSSATTAATFDRRRARRGANGLSSTDLGGKRERSRSRSVARWR